MIVPRERTRKTTDLFKRLFLFSGIICSCDWEINVIARGSWRVGNPGIVHKRGVLINSCSALGLNAWHWRVIGIHSSTALSKSFCLFEGGRIGRKTPYPSNSPDTQSQKLGSLSTILRESELPPLHHRTENCFFAGVKYNCNNQVIQLGTEHQLCLQSQWNIIHWRCIRWRLSLWTMCFWSWLEGKVHLNLSSLLSSVEVQ